MYIYYISEHWHKMSESEKKPYEDKYRVAKEKYDDLKKEYEEKYGKI